MSTTDNGVNVQALLEAREVLSGAPDAAQFTWRASSKWENGVLSTTSIQNFFGLGEEQSHKTEAVFDADHPEVFAAHDQGITPIEYLLVGLASCLTAGVASVAQNRGSSFARAGPRGGARKAAGGSPGEAGEAGIGLKEVRGRFPMAGGASGQELGGLGA